MKIKLFSLLVLLSSSLIASPIEQHFNTIKSEPNALYAFLKAMPKGGELHYHLAGSAYPETMLAIAAANSYCLDTQSYRVQTQNCNNLPSSQVLLSDSELYQQFVRVWSMKDFVPQKQSSHDHFFAPFEKFMPIVFKHRAQLLAKILERAANQNEQYLEIMALPDNGQSIAFGSKLEPYTTYQQKLDYLLNSKKFKQNIQFTIQQTDKLLADAKQFLRCDKNPTKKACNITVKFQYYTLRELPVNNFFAMAVNAFETAKQSKDIVGINFVQPEDSPASIRNIKDQMKIFNFLHQHYPSVNIALHAGELTVDNVPPAELRYHINDAVMIAHAQRIGHGVDIARENKAASLLKTMATKDIAVEINLSSNQWILGVSGKQHPLNYYLANQVPVTLSTDDEGILRTDLTTQYVKAVLEHGINYPQLKKINRNALNYSFLPGKSLWSDRNYQDVIPACASLQSQSCLQYIKQNPKAKLQRQLELKLEKFESSFKQP